jgi:hypothetical protein
MFLIDDSSRCSTELAGAVVRDGASRELDQIGLIECAHETVVRYGALTAYCGGARCWWREREGDVRRGRRPQLKPHTIVPNVLCCAQTKTRFRWEARQLSRGQEKDREPATFAAAGSDIAVLNHAVSQKSSAVSGLRYRPVEGVAWLRTTRVAIRNQAVNCGRLGRSY